MQCSTAKDRGEVSYGGGGQSVLVLRGSGRLGRQQMTRVTFGIDSAIQILSSKIRNLGYFASQPLTLNRLRFAHFCTAPNSQHLQICFDLLFQQLVTSNHYFPD